MSAVTQNRFSLTRINFSRQQYIFHLPSHYIVSPKTGFELQQQQQEWRTTVQ